MAKTKIEWCDYTINPVKGLCPMACSYCYARRLYKRFKWDETIRWEFSRQNVLDITLNSKPSKYFVGSTMELFGDWVEPKWMELIFDLAKYNSEHTFIFLTKQPQNLIKWSPFPNNCWVGVSTNGNDCRSGLEDIFKEVRAKVKFVSIEPLLDYTPMDFRWVDWVIIGQQTPISERTRPRPDWIRHIITSANTWNKPIFIKNNIIGDSWAMDLRLTEMRQEFPMGVK